MLHDYPEICSHQDLKQHIVACQNILLNSIQEPKIECIHNASILIQIHVSEVTTNFPDKTGVKLLNVKFFYRNMSETKPNN